MPHDRVGCNPQHLGDFLGGHGFAEVFEFHHGAFFRLTVMPLNPLKLLFFRHGK